MLRKPKRRDPPSLEESDLSPLTPFSWTFTLLLYPWGQNVHHNQNRPLNTNTAGDDAPDDVQQIYLQVENTEMNTVTYFMDCDD